MMEILANWWYFWWYDPRAEQFALAVSYSKSGAHGRIRTGDPLFTNQAPIEVSSRFSLSRYSRMSIASREFHSGGYNGGYRKQSTKLATDAPLLFGRALKKLAQRDRFVVLLVPGTVKQCDGTLPCQRKQFMKLLLTLGSLKLRVVTPLEFLPAPWIMPEPLAQLIGGSKLAEPEVKLESVLPDSARPESVNQDSLSASVGSGGVDAFELDLQPHT